MNKHGTQRGLTLIEMVITIIVLGIALAAVVSSIASMTQRSADPLVINKATALAQTYLDEILSKRFDENSPVEGGELTTAPAVGCTAAGPDVESGVPETRSNFDDVDDYHNPADVAPTDQNGAALLNYANYLVKVEVVCDGDELGFGSNNDAKRIDVTVTPPGQSAMVFSVYRGYF